MRIRYEIDPHNRLVISPSGKRSGIARYRKVTDGRFKIGKDNALSYHVKKSAGLKTPQNIKLKGKWSLDKEHNLTYSLNKWGNQIAGNKLTIKTGMLDAKKNSLIFAVVTKDRKGTRSIYTLNFQGAWQAGAKNKLSFNLQKNKYPKDYFLFQGAWHLDNNNRIVYEYTEKNKKHKFTLSGRWDISEKYRISYVLGAESKIRIAGRWRIKKGKGLLFQAAYGKKTQSLQFAADLRLKDNNTLSFRIKNTSKKGPGMEIELKRPFLGKDGTALLKFIAEKRQKTIELSAGFRW